MSKPRVTVVVLGDVGRSPRMQYHSMSLANEGYDVDIVGYAGSEPIKELACHPSVTFRYMTPFPNIKYCPRFLTYLMKCIWQSFTLFFALFFKQHGHHVLVQNPPAIPALGICWFYCLVMRSNYIIDWHNYGYSIMSLTLGKGHVLVYLSKWFEMFFGQKASSNLCVTIAMKKDLESRFGIRATTLHDRPPECFKPISVLDSHCLFKRLAEEHSVFRHETEPDQSRFTKMELGALVLREDRPGLLVSSTSWTEDEDFSILLSALQDYESARTANTKEFPILVCVITGKGPLKEHYLSIIQEKAWKHVVVVTLWLQPNDYPLLLASADVGVCLHTSSSGLDLPMKVADMFGCGLPVMAYNFPCLNELVHHEENSYTFDNAEQLSEQIISWFRGFPENLAQQEIIAIFKRELQKYQQLRWHENWLLNAGPLFS